MRIILTGDQERAGQYLGWAKNKLNYLKRRLSLSGLNTIQKEYHYSDADVYLKSSFGLDTVRIDGIGELRKLIICFLGETTVDWTNKRYFILSGNTILEIGEPSGLIDDGKYGMIFDVPRDDPDDYTYRRTEERGLGIASVINGIAAKNRAQNRYILNSAMEDEIYKGWEQTVKLDAHTLQYGFQQLEDSLILNPLKIKSKPFVSRYVDDGVLTIHHRWKRAVNNVLHLDSYASESFHDNLPITKRIYHKAFEKDDKGNHIRRFKVIEGDGASAAACNYYSDMRKTQDIIRANTFGWFKDEMAEPLQRELYDFSKPPEEKPEEREKYYRSPYPGGSYCTRIDNDHRKVFWVHGNMVSCKTINAEGFTTRSGLDTISNDIKIPYSIDEDGKLTYVRFQKDTEFTQCKTGVYLADELVEESGWEEVDKLYGDTKIHIREANGCPIFLRKTTYQILHCHNEEYFKAIMYRKVVYLSHSSELVPFRVWRGSPLNYFAQIRKSRFDSVVTFYIAVKTDRGLVITQLKDRDGKAYKCDNSEYQLTALSQEYSDDEPPIPSVGFLHQFTYCDIDDNNNSNLTRIFTNEATGTLLIGFDVFPVNWRHNLVREQIGTSGVFSLFGRYDDTLYPFPHTSDGRYEKVKDRHWLLFNMNGEYTEVEPPKREVGGKMEHWNRVNGLCLLEKEFK